MSADQQASPERPAPWRRRLRNYLYAEDAPYKALEIPAKNIKTILQMAIGLFTLVLLGKHLFWAFGSLHHSCTPVQPPNTAPTSFCYPLPSAPAVLKLASDALALSAAVELVYMLFTPGPDEALEPLMLGLSAAALLQLGNADKLNMAAGVAVLLYALALSVLFLARERFVERPRRDEAKARRSVNQIPANAH